MQVWICDPNSSLDHHRLNECKTLLSFILITGAELRGSEREQYMRLSMQSVQTLEPSQARR